VPYRLCETASFSGGGKPGVSDTFAAALWALDYLFVLASHGCGGVNMETGVNHLGRISYYTPISDDLAGHYSAAPEYYGLLAFAQFVGEVQISVSVVAQGDLVIVTSARTLQDPKDSSKSYTTTWFDMWRIKDGKADEHWDPAVKTP
jgi:hypothetical protein